jgi:hypothetical protein
MSEPKHEHGGKRHGAGRKPTGDRPFVRVTISLDPQHIAALATHGEGNVSEGVRRLVESSLLH